MATDPEVNADIVFRRFKPPSYDLQDTLTGTVMGYTVYHHVTDHLGSVRAVVYAGGTAPSAQAGISPGTVVETSDYLPFGTRWTLTGGSAAGTLTDATNRWRYSGRRSNLPSTSAYRSSTTEPACTTRSSPGG